MLRGRRRRRARPGDDGALSGDERPMNTARASGTRRPTTRSPTPQFDWGMEVLERLELNGDETVLDAGCGSRPGHRAAGRAPAARAGDRRRRLRGDDRRGPRRLGDRGHYRSPISRSWSSTSRSTWSSPPRPSIGSPTTTASSRACARRCARAAASSPSAAARATSPSTRGDRRCRRRPEFAALRADAGDAWNFAGAGGDRGRLRNAGFERSRCWLEPEAGQPPSPLRVHLHRHPRPATWSSCRRRSASLRRAILAESSSRSSSTTSASTSRRAPALSRIECRAVTERPAHSPAARRRHRARDRRRRARLLEALGEFEFERGADGRLLDRRQRHRAHRRGDRRLPRLRRGPARRRRRARNGTPTPTRRAPSRACSACAREWASTPTCAPCDPARPWSAPARWGGAHRRHRPAGRARADRRHLLRRQRPRRRPAHDTCEYSAAEIERIARVGFEAARAAPRARTQAPRHLGRQGQRARDLAPVARGGRPRRPRVPRRRARPPPGRQRGDAARPAPGRLRRDRHREPVRRHPQRRGGDADRLAGHAALGLARRTARRASSSRSTAPPPTSPARASPTRSPPSSRRR